MTDLLKLFVLRFVLLLVAATACFSAQATPAHNLPLSTVLQANGFSTLAQVLDLQQLTSTLDQNRVNLFAPTDDVFNETASALGCENAVDLATRLANININETDNALSLVLKYHVNFGRVNARALLLNKEITTLADDSISTGVNRGGLYVKGKFNQSVSNITSPTIWGRNYTIHAIDQILLPIEVPADLCK